MKLRRGSSLVHTAPQKRCLQTFSPRHYLWLRCRLVARCWDLAFDEYGLVPSGGSVECIKNGIMFDVAKSHFMFVWSSVTLCRIGDSVRFNILNTHSVHQVCST